LIDESLAAIATQELHATAGDKDGEYVAWGAFE
jgi:hypothetical protein